MLFWCVFIIGWGFYWGVIFNFCIGLNVFKSMWKYIGDSIFVIINLRVFEKKDY